jgi:ketoreductase
MNERNTTALVTGGTSGIGLAIGRALLECGWKVAICGRDEAKLSRARDELTRACPEIRDRLHGGTVDVSSADQVRSWVGEACDRLGAPALLVNNAGVGASGAVSELDESTWDRALDINLKGTFLCTREVLPRMRAGGGGWIVNIASVAGKKGMPRSSAYSASKFGVVGFTEALGREQAAHGIRATAICPGYVSTPMVAGAPVPASEMIRPEDVAATVLYLLELGPNVAVREIVLDRLGAL